MPRVRQLLGRLGQLEPAALDWIAAVVLLVAIEAQVWLGPAHAGRAASAVGGAAVATAVALRRRWPIGAAVLALGGMLVTDALGGAVSESAVATVPAGVMIAYGVGRFASGRQAWAGLGILIAGLAFDIALTTRAAADLFFSVVVLGMLSWTAGWTVRRRAQGGLAHRAHAERLDTERDARARAAAEEERARVARELHDVIAHSVAVMVIQASGARLVMDAEPARAEESLGLVEHAGREALVEMRRLLGVMDEDTAPAPLAPAPGIADIPDLVARARDAGVETRLDVRGGPCPVTPGLELCAYRIVQEALTNAIRHADPQSVTVQLRWSAEALEVIVADDGRGSSAGNGQSGGHGLAGMRERAALHGGRIDADAGPAGGFVVRAHLPLATGRVA